MKHPLPPLDSLKVFEAAARHLSFSMAADELCISKAAVSYQIRKLETRLQCNLFKRTIRQVYLTEAGQKLLQTTRQVFAQLEESLQHLQTTPQQNTVLLAATTYVAARWLSPRITAFNARYPGVIVQFQHTVNSADFKLQEVDLAIRWGKCGGNDNRNVLAEIEMPLFPVASPALLARTGLQGYGHNPDVLLQEAYQSLPLLTEDRQLDLWQAWCGTERVPGNPRRVIADANVRVQAAIDGQGLILADAMMRAELEHGLLIAPFQHSLSGYGYKLLAAPGNIEHQGTACLREWLVACISKEAEIIPQV